MSELQGKAAVITGASRGIGKAAAEVLAGQGVAVTLAARSLGDIQTIAAEIEKAGGKAEAVACDVANYDQIKAALARCKERFGSLDILINNAGLIEPIGRLIDTDPADWRKAAEVNYLGVYHGLRAAIPVMIEQGGGVIVNVSSGAATSAMEGWSHYCSSKAAALSLTQCADLEYRDQGIRVLGLSPGTVATHMQVVIKASGINPVSKLNLSDHIPPEWAGRALAWLCTEDAAEFAGTDVRLRSEDIRRRIGLID